VLLPPRADGLHLPIERGGGGVIVALGEEVRQRLLVLAVRVISCLCRVVGHLVQGAAERVPPDLDEDSGRQLRSTVSEPQEMQSESTGVDDCAVPPLPGKLSRRPEFPVDQQLDATLDHVPDGGLVHTQRRPLHLGRADAGNILI
jgi:hypothetical protein